MIRILVLLATAVNLIVVAMAGVNAYVLRHTTEKPYDAIPIHGGVDQPDEGEVTISMFARYEHRHLRYNTLRFGSPHIVLSIFNLVLLRALFLHSPHAGNRKGAGNMAFANGVVAFMLLLQEPNYFPNPLVRLARLESELAATPEEGMVIDESRRTAILVAVAEAKASALSLRANYNRNGVVFLTANLCNILLFIWLACLM